MEAGKLLRGCIQYFTKVVYVADGLVYRTVLEELSAFGAKLLQCAVNFTLLGDADIYADNTGGKHLADLLSLKSSLCDFEIDLRQCWIVPLQGFF